MFAQCFLLIAGVVVLVAGVRDGDWLVGICGVVMAVGAAVTLYQIKTGKW